MSDKYDRKKVILISIGVFIFGSAMSVIAENYSVLLIGRVLQGIGIAAPSILAYVIIADHYNSQKQVILMGWINGVSVFIMSAAPVIGSYIAAKFGWRGNFMTLLLLSILVFIISSYAIKSVKSKPDVKISLKAYVPLLRSKKFMLFAYTLCFFVVPYWIFVGLSPILYMEVFGVSLSTFGFYQAVLAIMFAIGSASIGSIAQKIGNKKALFCGIALCAVYMMSVAMIMIFDIRDAVIVTLSMCIGSIAVSVPFTILYPHALSIVEDSKGRSSAVISGMRLVFSSVGLMLASFHFEHDPSFFPLGIWILALMAAAITSLTILIKKYSQLIH